VAQAKGHCPGIFLHSWNMARLILGTSAMAILQINYFILPSRINGLLP
jgi:hypothetical protein